MAKRRDGLTTRWYKSDIGMQRWVSLGVISDQFRQSEAIDEPTKGSVDIVLAIKSRSDPGGLPSGSCLVISYWRKDKTHQF